MQTLLRNRSFVGLTSAQVLGAVNDNLFKMVVSLLAVVPAANASSSYLSLSAAVYIIPYLLCSGYAGYLADIAPKRSVLIGCKLAEIAIMALALLAVLSGAGPGALLFVLFLMAMHSSFFSPAKFGSVPEMVDGSQIARANGVLEATRYGAIILGTAAGGILMDLWGMQLAYIGLASLGIAVAGFLCSLNVERRPAAQPATAMPLNPWRGLGEGFKRIRRNPVLVTGVAGITFFETAAGLMMLDVLLTAKLDLGFSDTQAGTLAAFAALGTGAGALLYSRIAIAKAEAASSPFACLAIALCLAAVAGWAHDFRSLAALLFVLGICSALFFVPFLGWLQTAAKPEEKGLVLSANNFLNMVGVLFSCGALWLLHDVAGISPRSIFLVVAAACVVFASGLLWKCAELRAQIATAARRLRQLQTGWRLRAGY